MLDNTVQEIKDRLNIADIIGGYLPLKKAGVNFKANCPFHNEKTPSFNVNTQKQIWHCFGCGEGGDAFGFVMRYENVDFKEALKILAQKAGVVLPDYKPKDQKLEQEKEQVYRINLYATKLYHQVLLQDKQALIAREYLAKRGLSPETIEQWQIGFAPQGFHYLLEALDKKKISRELMVKAGVVVKGEGQKYYDRFRGRITFPIFDPFGKPIGFSARILPEFDEGKAGKYINSPETLIYQKSKILFGLNFAKDAIRKTKEAIVAEGQMDVIASHQAGVKNIIATSGTALTLEQLNLLKRLADTLLFCFDSDSAGQLALRRAVESAITLDFNLKVIKILNAKDADELISQGGNLWPEAISKASPFFDYHIKEAFSQYEGKVEEKKKIAKDVLSLLTRLPDPVEQDHYLLQLAKNLGTSEKALRESLGKVSKKPLISSLNESIVPQPVSVFNTIMPEEKEVFGGILLSREFYGHIQTDLAGEDFENPDIQQGVKKIISGISPATVEDTPFAREAMFMVESMLETLGAEAVFKQLNKSYGLLKIKQLKKKQKFLQNEIARAENAGKTNEVKALQVEFVKISQLIIMWEKK